MKKLLLITLMGLFLFAAPTYAAEFYIDADNGHDGDAGTETAPWQSLAKINSISGGDTVYLKGEFNNGGTLALNSSISGTGSDPTTITVWENEEADIMLIANSYALSINASYLEIIGIRIHNNGTPISKGDGIHLNDGVQGVSLIDNTISDARYGISSSGTAGTGIEEILIFNNDITDNYAGIYALYISDLQILNSNIQDNIGIGMLAMGGSTVLIANNNISDSVEAGIYGSSVINLRAVNNSLYNNTIGFSTLNCTTPLFKNNIVVNSTYNAVMHQGSTNPVYDYNLYHGNSLVGNVGGLTSGVDYNFTDWQNIGYDEHSLEGDPLFEDITNNNFHIQESSPAIDTGLDLSNYITYDIDNEDRPHNSVFDIGADERVVPEAPANVNTTDLGPKRMTVAWEQNEPDTTFDVIAADNHYFNDPTTTTTAEKEVSYADLKTTKLYYYKIRACNIMDICSDYTEATFKTTPAKVTNVKKLKKYRGTTSYKIRWKRQPRVNKYKLRLTWTSPEGKKKYKNIYVKNNNTNDIITISGDSVRIKRRMLTGLKPSTSYYVKVKAIDGSGLEGRYSNRIKFKTR